MENIRQRINHPNTGSNPSASTGGDASNPPSSGAGPSPWQMPSAWPQPPTTYPEYRTSAEYANAVRQWMWQYHMWNQMNWFYMTFPFYAMSCMAPPTTSTPSAAGQFPQVPAFRASFSPANAPHPPAAAPARDARLPNGEYFPVNSLSRQSWTSFVSFFHSKLLSFQSAHL